MFDETKGNASRSETPAWELLVELEKNVPEAIRAQRSTTRINIRAKVTAEPASLSQRDGTKNDGVTGDISAGGTQILFSKPAAVGDVYILTFDRSSLDSAPIFARCMRCRLVREDAFEVGFSFFAPIDISSLVAETLDDCVV